MMCQMYKNKNNQPQRSRDSGIPMCAWRKHSQGLCTKNCDVNVRAHNDDLLDLYLFSIRLIQIYSDVFVYFRKCAIITKLIRKKKFNWNILFIRQPRVRRRLPYINSTFVVTVSEVSLIQLYLWTLPRKLHINMYSNRPIAYNIHKLFITDLSWKQHKIFVHENMSRTSV